MKKPISMPPKESEPTPTERMQACLEKIMGRKAGNYPRTESILGRNPNQEPIPYHDRSSQAISWHGKRKQRRNTWQMPGQNAAELGSGNQGNNLA